MIPDEPDIALHMPYLEEVAFRSPFIIELGCGDGYGSTRAFQRGHSRRGQDRFHVSVEIRPDRPVSYPGSVMWFLLHGDTANYLTVVDLAKDLPIGWSLRKADLIFIDTEHTGTHIWKELLVWQMMATPDTVWLFHDTWMFGQYNPMTDAIKQFADEHGLVYEDLSKECNGLGRMASKQASLIPYFASGEKGSAA